MRTEKTTITPARARELLKGNGNNRQLRIKHVEYLAAEITGGRWVCTHQGIAISKDGKVVDGQHRLEACIMANRPIDVMLFKDVPMSVQDVSDSGAIRSVPDQLHITDGLKNANITVAGVRAIISLVCFGNNPKLSVQVARDIHAFYASEIEIVVNALRETRPLLKGWIVGSLAFAMKADRRSREFVDKFGSGQGLVRGDPALAARNWIINGNGLIAFRDYRRSGMEALLNSVYNSVHGNPITLIKRGSLGADYFIGRERKNVTTIREQFVGQSEVKKAA